MRPIVADTPDAILIPFNQVPSYVRSLAVCRVLDQTPTQQFVEWMAKTRPEPYEDGGYYNPYLLRRLPGTTNPIVAVAPWAVTGFNYLSALTGSERLLTQVEPARWYTGLMAEMIAAYSPLPEPVKDCLEVADWLYTVDGAEAAGDQQARIDIEILFDQVRLSAASGSLITDNKKTRRLFGR